MASTFSSGGSITSTNRDSKGNAGKWNQRPDKSWVFVANKPADNTPALSPNYPGPPTYAPAGTPAASQGPSGAPQTPTAAPVDPAYQAILAQLQKTRDDTTAGLSGQQNSLLSNYGYQASYDPSGGVSGLSFDPSNPFSRAALLQKTYQEAQAGAKNSSAASGQYNSGSYQNALNRAYFSEQAGENSLKSDLTSQLASLIGQKTAASDQYGQNAAQAFGDSLSRAAAGQNPTYTPATPTAQAAVPNPQSAASGSGLAARKVAKTVNGVQYYMTASGKLAPIPKGAPIIK